MDRNKVSNFQTIKLDVREVLKKSTNIYKEGFKAFITLSALTFIMGLISSIVDYGSKFNKTNVAVSLLLALLTFILFLARLFISFKVEIAIYILAKRLFRGKEISAREAYLKSKEIFWTYIGVNILFVSILALPMICILLSYNYIQGSELKFAVIFLLLVPTGYLYVKYGFASVSTILEKEKHQYFKNSKLIVKGDFWRILFLIVISNFVFMVPYQIYIHLLFDYNQMTELHKFMASGVNQLFYVFTLPFSAITAVVMYLTLKRNKRIG